MPFCFWSSSSLTVLPADALRDFEFIHDNRWNTHFVKDIAASRLDDGQGSRLQAALIWELGLKAPASHRTLFRDSDLLGSFNPKLMQHGTSVGRSLGTGRAHVMASEERRVQFRMTLKRFAFAIIGGLIIVVPMLILVVGNATAKTLAVISSSIFLFAVSVAFFSTIEPENLLVATAAYAAVLMALIRGSSQNKVWFEGLTLYSPLCSKSVLTINRLTSLCHVLLVDDSGTITEERLISHWS